MNFIRSCLHFLFMIITVIPWATVVMISALFRRPEWVYKVATGWLTLSTRAARLIMGIRYEVTGYENLPQGATDGAILLVKHQSVWETFAMPGLMPHPLAYVFKKELLAIPFFGWSMACMDMIHIDRSLKAQAFNKIVEQGKRLLAKGTWVIMFPEGTRIERGQAGVYKEGGTRLAIATGVPVIPIAVTAAKCWPRKAFIKKPGLIQVSIGPAISPYGKTSAELMLEVKTWIEAEMQRLDPEAYFTQG